MYHQRKNSEGCASFDEIQLQRYITTFFFPSSAEEDDKTQRNQSRESTSLRMPNPK